MPDAVRAVFQRYHARPTEKALAISTANTSAHSWFGQAEFGAAEAGALAACETQAKRACRILLRNFDVVKGD